MKTLTALILAALAAVSAQPAAAAAARPVTDCPLRNAPFSVDSPLIDILLSPAAKAVLDRAAPGSTSRLHGSAGDFIYFWNWYADTLIGARFMSHPMGPQFQDAKVVVDKTHPLAKVLPDEWVMNDEWYSFKTNPRRAGAKVLATLDESTYSPVGIGKMDLRMGDHPIAWTNCIGKGRSFYSAIGHRPETYSEPHYVAMLEAAIDWAAISGKGACEKVK